jgi:hypothetical protein
MGLQTLWTTNYGDAKVFVPTSVNLTATTDPGVSNDNTQGYGPGSIWINTTSGALRWWECVSAATGAAVWSFAGAAYGAGGAAPSTEVVQFGLGSAQAAAEGNIYRQVSGPGVTPASTGADIVVGVYAMPANSFDVAGRGVNVLAQGGFAATTNNKRVKIIWNATTATVGSAVVGGTTICDTGVVTGSAVGWAVEANVFKYGAAGSNTQLGVHVSAQSGAVVSSLLSPTLMTAAESGAINIAVTANATTATSDILLNFLEVNAMN